MKLDFAAWHTIVCCVGKDHSLRSERSFSIGLQHWEHCYNLIRTQLQPRENSVLIPWHQRHQDKGKAPGRAAALSGQNMWYLIYNHLYYESQQVINVENTMSAEGSGPPGSRPPGSGPPGSGRNMWYLIYNYLYYESQQWYTARLWSSLSHEFIRCAQFNFTR